MSLEILNIIPASGTNNLTTDTKFSILFNEAIDPFTIKNGITIYSIRDNNWSGPDLYIMNNEISSISDNTGYEYVDFDYVLTGNSITITPKLLLKQDKKYFISIFPGNNAERYISASTFGSPDYTRIGNSNGTLEQISSYLGQANSIYLLYKTDTGFDLLIDNVYAGSVIPVDGILSLENITLKINGSFDEGDSISLYLNRARGVEVLYKAEYTTSLYETIEPQSILVEEFIPNISIVDSIPENLSVNNKTSNPIIIKFNKQLNPNQDLSNKITIKRIGLQDGRNRHLSYKYKINGNTLKIYLVTG